MLLANILIAAALGAGTNELAIVAILRYILPRKKSEIAARIRDVIATDLVSPDKLRDKLDDPAVAGLLEHNLDDALAAFLERDLPGPDDLLPDHRAALDAMTDRAVAGVLDEFARRTAEPDFARDVVRPFLADRWEMLRGRTPRSLLTTQAERLPAFVEGWILSLADARALRDAVRRGLDRWLGQRIDAAQSAADLLSPGLAAAAEELAVSQAPAVIGQLAGILREPSVQGTIAGGIMEAIRGQLRGQGVMGGLKEAFVNAIGVRRDIEGVCRRLPDALESSFREPLNRERLTVALRFAVRQGLGREIQAEFRTPAGRARFLDLALDGLWRPETFAAVAKKAAALVAGALDRELGDIAAALGGEASRDAVLDEATARVRRMLLHPATRAAAEAQLREALTGWRQRPLGRLDRFVGPDARHRLAAAGAREALELVRARLEDLTEKSGLWDIVVTSIEEYDDRQLGDMIRHLARSELRWVTVLGGCIGAVVGAVQTFMGVLPPG